MKPGTKRNIIAAAVTAAVLVLALIGNIIVSDGVLKRREGALRVTFVDCGEADCILLQTDGFNMLIDTGGGAYEECVGRLRRAGIKKLDCFVITHYDIDHSAGSPEVITAFDPGLILLPYADAAARQSIIYQQLARLGGGYTEAVTGQEYIFGSIQIEVLAPNNSAYKEDNEASIVLKCTYNGNSFIFAADTTASEEAVMLSKYNGELDCDVLKVSHHGSAASSGEEFLASLSPKVAVISCGANTYGHPSAEVINRLNACGADVYTTWEHGDITVDSYCGELTVYCSKP